MSRRRLFRAAAALALLTLSFGRAGRGLADEPKSSSATPRKVLNGWGPGKFDAEVFLDGKALRPDGKPAATLSPPAFGLLGVNLHIWTGWGSVTHWNAFVAILEMHGKGMFFDPRLNDATKFPIAAKAGFGNVRNLPDLVTPKLAALQYYQLSIPSPQPPAGSFDAAAAKRGEALFAGAAKCSTCHVNGPATPAVLMPFGDGSYGRISRLTSRSPTAARAAVSAKRPRESSVGIDVTTIDGVGLNVGVNVGVSVGMAVGVLVGV